MEHFRILLTNQKEAVQKDKELLAKEILEAEEVLEKLRERNNEANKTLRYLTKKLEKLN